MEASTCFVKVFSSASSLPLFVIPAKVGMTLKQRHGKAKWKDYKTITEIWRPVSFSPARLLRR